jgi:carboxymethylenebutenolidase
MDSWQWLRRCLTASSEGLSWDMRGRRYAAGEELYSKARSEKSLADVAAAIRVCQSATGKKVGVIGYCYGGTIAWLAATRLHVPAAVGYYGGRTSNYANEPLSAPVMLHFGKLDAHIPQRK